MLVFCALFNDVELFVDLSSQAEQEQKKRRVDEQQSAIDVTPSSSPACALFNDVELFVARSRSRSRKRMQFYFRLAE